jgi:trehalose-phosphatase
MREILEHVPRGVPLAVLLDYDGTLVAIRPRPDLARLTPERRDELRGLGRRALVAVVSGRPLAEIRRMVGLPRLVYLGNHGLEIRAHGRTWVHPEAARRAELIAKTVEAVRAGTKGLAGVIVEDKGLTATVHFRLAARRHLALIRAVVTDEVGRSRGGLIVCRGKKVLEIRPHVPWDKGQGVLEVLRRAGGRRPPFPVYIGDDRTDEDAFRSLRAKGLTIRVGRGGRTLARWRLSGVDAVWAFLAALRSRLE